MNREVEKKNLPYIKLLKAIKSHTGTFVAMDIYIYDGSMCRKKYGTVNRYDLDSVTLKAFKVKDCGQILGSKNCI